MKFIEDIEVLEAIQLLKDKGVTIEMLELHYDKLETTHNYNLEEGRF